MGLLRIVDGSTTRRRLAVVAALVLVTAACGGDDDTADPAPDASSTTDAAEEGSWCDVYDDLRSSDDFGGVEVAGAPEEIRGPLQELAEASTVDTEDVPPGTLTRLFEANAAVETWGYDHCGGDHPFCSVWIAVEQGVAVSALSGDDEATAYLKRLVDELEPVLTEHVPPELSDELATALTFTRASSDEDERAAEDATDALDEWARSEGCAGAPPEEDDEAAAP
ncbi:MAG: hypothetical protein ACJ739_04460 [Acidimicrobiales bacterium]